MTNFNNTHTGAFYVAACIILWSLIPSFAKFAQNTLDQHQYMFYSSTVSFITLLCISIYQKKAGEVFSYSIKTLSLLLLLGFLNFLYYLLLYLGYKEANGLEVLVIQYLWPIFIVVLSLILLKEKLSKNKVLSVLIGFTGVTIVITKGNIHQLDFSNLNILLIVMIGTFSFALFSVLSKTIKVNLTNSVMIYFLAASIYSYISINTFSRMTFPLPNDWISIIINGVFLNGISYLFWIKALKQMDASQVAPYIFITPILSASLLILIFNEPILPVYYIGLILVIISGLINTKFSRH